jgi:AcrR family transcriptional regulator
MPRPPDERRRRELLDALVEAFAAGGIGGRSLRDLATTVGTSHRMLLHHFGSRDDLLLAIVGEVERRQAAELEGLPEDAADATAAMWAILRRRRLRPFARLFFECYARAAHGEEPFKHMLPGAIDGWLAALAARAGGAPDPALARLGLAVFRGLLLDLVASGDEKGVDAAAARFVVLLRGGQTAGRRSRSARAAPSAQRRRRRATAVRQPRP